MKITDEQKAQHDKEVVEIMKTLGFGDAKGVLYDLKPWPMTTIKLDLSAVKPDMHHIVAQIISQVYSAGYQNGSVSKQAEIKMTLGIRS